jgi:hypothetical protein
MSHVAAQIGQPTHDILSFKHPLSDYTRGEVMPKIIYTGMMIFRKIFTNTFPALMELCLYPLDRTVLIWLALKKISPYREDYSNKTVIAPA